MAKTLLASGAVLPGLRLVLLGLQVAQRELPAVTSTSLALREFRLFVILVHVSWAVILPTIFEADQEDPLVDYHGPRQGSRYHGYQNYDD